MRQATRFTLPAGVSLAGCLLCACGGGGGGSSAPASYAIGGSVSGLTQLSGVVLQNNGGDALSMSADGAFTFASRVASGAAYDVTVKTQPTGETCTVTDGQGNASARVDSIDVSCTSNYANPNAANVAVITVSPGPASASDQTFNIPQVTVTVCNPQTQACATISDVLVDTGSSGLRLLSQALPAGFTLPPMADPNHAGNTINECMLFADGYSWGSVAYATVTVADETTGPTTGIPVQIINSSSSPSPPVPSECSHASPGIQAENTVDDFDANGVLGVSVLNQDCGSECVGGTANDNGIYYTCSATSCSSTGLTELTDEVANPVASFPNDNNGVIVQLPAISSSGAVGASGYLVFGIGTETAGATEADNSLNSATVLTAYYDGLFNTTFSGQQLGYSFIDSGSNGLYFPQPTPNLALCGNSPPANEFYCPNSTTSLSATNEGEDAQGSASGPTSDVSFQVASLKDISPSDFAINDAAGTALSIPGFGTNGTAYFDWGVPFLYGRTVFNAIENTSAAGTMGPYYAY